MEQVGNILPEIFRREVRRADSRLIDILGPLWPRVAGKAIASQSRPVNYESGTLALETSCLTWAAELRRMEGEICSKINAFLGSQLVKRVRVQFVPKPAVSAGARREEKGEESRWV